MTSRSAQQRRQPRAHDAADEARGRIESVLKREAPGLLAYFQRRVRPVEDAADLLSETMLVAWRRADALPTEEMAARMWLYGVARNALSTHRRGQARRGALAAELRAEVLSEARSVSRDGQIERDDRVELLRSLVDALPDLDREIFRLVSWEGFALTKVGEMLGIPAGTIRSRYSRARAALRKQIENAMSAQSSDPA